MNSLIRVILLAGLAVLSRPAFATPSFEANPSMLFEFATDYDGEPIYQGGLGGSIDVYGNDEDSFYNRETFQFTNTSDEDQTFFLYWAYWIGGIAEADPTQGETLTYAWDVSFGDLIPEEYGYGIGESQSHVCSPSEMTQPWSCNAFYDGNEGHESLLFAAGETKTFDLLMDFRASASVGVPEAPSLFVMMAGLLCFVVLHVSRSPETKKSRI